MYKILVPFVWFHLSQFHVLIVHSELQRRFSACSEAILKGCFGTIKAIKMALDWFQNDAKTKLACSNKSKRWDGYLVKLQAVYTPGYELIWAMSWENLFYAYANNKGADQPAHPRSLISAFVVRFLDSIIPLVSLSEISRLSLASEAEQAGLSPIWSQTPKTGFLVTRLI